MSGLKVIDGTPSAISKYLREEEKNKGCGKRFFVGSIGSEKIYATCGTEMPGAGDNLCDDCSQKIKEKQND